MRRDLLRKHYETNGLSIAQVAQAAAQTYEEVWQALQRAQIPRRHPKLDLKVISPDWLHWAYWEEKRTLQSIADDYEVTPASVLAWMEAAGIPRRAPGGSFRGVLSEEAVRFLRQLFKEGVKPAIIRQRLAEEMGVDLGRQAIYNVCHGKAWKDVVT